MGGAPRPDHRVPRQRATDLDADAKPSGKRAAAISAAFFVTLPMELHYGDMVDFEPCLFMWMLAALVCLRGGTFPGAGDGRWLRSSRVRWRCWMDWPGYFFVLAVAAGFLVGWLLKRPLFPLLTSRRSLQWALLLIGITGLSGLLFLSRFITQILGHGRICGMRSGCASEIIWSRTPPAQPRGRRSSHGWIGSRDRAWNALGFPPPSVGFAALEHRRNPRAGKPRRPALVRDGCHSHARRGPALRRRSAQRILSSMTSPRST